MSNFDFSKKFGVATVDATSIALEHEILVGGIPVVNTPILGAVPKILKQVTLPSIQSVIKEVINTKAEDRIKNAKQSQLLCNLFCDK